MPFFSRLVTPLILLTLAAGPGYANESAASLAPLSESSVDDFEGVVDLEVLVPAVKNAFGRRFGDVWIDRGVAPSVLRVNIVEPVTDQDEVTLATVADNNPRIVLRSVRYPLERLLRYQKDLDAILRVLPGPHVTGQDASLNKVVVDLRSLPPDIAVKVSTAVPSDAVLVRVSESFNATRNHSDRMQYPPHDAGLWASVEDPSSPVGFFNCTSGYTVVKDGAYYGITAGHCAPSGAWNAWDVVLGVKPLGGVIVGTAQSNTYWCCNPSFSDALKYPIANSDARRLIYTGGTGHRTVIRQISENGMPLGYRMCFQGIVSENNNCGDTNRTNASFTDPDGRVTWHVWCIAYPIGAKDGDSGGPYYHVRSDGEADANGIHLGTTSLIGGPVSACMSTLQQVIPGVGADHLAATG